MIEAKLRVEKTSTSKFNTHYYGNVGRKEVVESILMRDFDKRGDTIAPKGIKAALFKNELDKDGKVYAMHGLDITINKYYLDYLDTDNGMMEYYCHFSIDGRIYQFNVYFDCDTKEIKDYYLEEWFNEGEFEDGADADNVYHKGEDEFVSLVDYIS